MSEGALHDVYGSAAIQGVAGGGVPQPVRGGVLFQFCAFGGPSDDIPDSFACERASCALPDMVLRLRVRRGLAQRGKDVPYGGGDRHFPGVRSFSAERELSAVFPFPQVFPGEADHFRDACAGGVEGEQQGVVSRVWSAMDHALYGAFGEDSGGQGAGSFRYPESASDVVGQVSDVEGEGEQALYGGDPSRPGGGGQGRQRVGPVLELRQGEGAEPFGNPDHQRAHVPPVSFDGAGGLSVEPGSKEKGVVRIGRQYGCGRSGNG